MKMYNIINQIISFFPTRTITKEEINNHCAKLNISRDQLTEFTIPDNVTYIDIGAFRGCTSLTSITIPDSVTKIDSMAFRYCTSLESINIPDGVTKIGNFAFYECNSLT